MVTDVCCGFKKRGMGWWRTSAVVSKKGVWDGGGCLLWFQKRGCGMVADVCWCFKKGSAVVLVSGKEWHGSFWDGLTRGIMLL